MNKEIEELLKSTRFNHLLSANVRKQIDTFVTQKTAINANKEKIISNALIYGDTDDHTVAAGLYMLSQLVEANPENKEHVVMYGDIKNMDLDQLEKPFILVLQPSDLTNKDEVLPKLSYFFENPECTLIVCSKEEKIIECFHDDHVFYDLLSEHIKISETNVDDVYNSFIEKLSSAPYTPTEDFKKGIKEYISVIYTDARMKENDFVNDLYNRVMRNVYKRSDVAHIEAEDVPYSTKLNATRINNEKQANTNTKDTSRTDIKEILLDEEQTNIFKSERDFKYSEQTLTTNREQKNVLLLAMSTPSIYENKASLYSYKDETNKYLGVTQLDTVPKMLASKLNLAGEALDHIVILQTDKSYHEGSNSYAKGARINYRLLNNENQIMEEMINATGFDCFVKHVDQFINPNTSEKYISVEVNEYDPASGISEAINKLRELGNLNLYIDEHGGFRSVQLLSTAITSLLKKEKITIKDIYTVHTDKHMIIKDESIRIFDFVSGINEFLNYGHSFSLQKFINTDDKLPELINNLSSSIQLCDMDLFHNILDELRQYYSTNKEHTSNYYLQIFSKQIKIEYGKLLEDHDVLDEIEWCNKNEFIQQALTLIESKMPEELVKKQVILYKPNATTPVTIIKDTYKHEVHVNNTELMSAIGKKNWESDTNYIFIKWARKQFNKTNSSEKTTKFNNIYDPSKMDDRKLIITFNKANEEVELINFEDDKYIYPSGTRASYEYKDDKTNKNNYKYSASFDLSNAYILTAKPEEYYNFLQLHLKLKEARNNTNHAQKGNRISTEKIKKAIVEYCRLARELYEATSLNQIELPKKEYDKQDKIIPEKLERICKILIATLKHNNLLQCEWSQLKKIAILPLPNDSEISSIKRKSIDMLSKYYHDIFEITTVGDKTILSLK